MYGQRVPFYTYNAEKIDPPDPSVSADLRPRSYRASSRLPFLPSSLPLGASEEPDTSPPDVLGLVRLISSA